MPANLLLQHFETLADTPDAVPKLRAFVLDLAVRGRLVPRAETPDNDSAWLEFRAGFDTPTQGAGAIPSPPFEPPDYWCWTFLSEIADCRAAAKVTPSEISDDDWVLDLEDIDGKTGNVVATAKFSERRSLSTKAAFQKGDVLYGKLRPYLNKVVVAERPGFCTTEIIPLRPEKFLSPKYLRFFLRSPHFVQYAQSLSYGMKMPRLGTDDLEEAQVAVPPPEEQRRIVAKVEELLALCDELESRQVATREHRTRLVHSALDHLTAAKDETDFRKQCSFILRNSSLILDSVPSLRQAILSLAVQGRLVPQNAKQDGTAEQALGGRRSRLKSNGALGKVATKAFPPIDESDIPVPVPGNWKWIRFGEVVDRLEYGTSEKAFANAKGVPTLRMGNIQDGKLDLNNLKYVPHACPDLPKLFLEDGDIIFNRTNSAELVGKAAVFRGKPKSFTLASYLIRASLDEAIASPDFFVLAINSSYYRRTQIEPELTQQCGQANFSGSKLANSVVPLPPIAEQQRIVAKVDELMRWCDALEAGLTAAETTATHLLDATLDRALKGES